MSQVPIKWPKSRDAVWKANIPHTHLAHEKSDQNWMVVKGEKIVFPGGGTHFHYGADKYIASIANVRVLAYIGNVKNISCMPWRTNNYCKCNIVLHTCIYTHCL